MKKILILTLIPLILISCSVKKQDATTMAETGARTQEIESIDLKTYDSDGDMITDQEEIDRGTNRKLADVPELKVRFLQDYQIKIKYQEERGEEKIFEIDTKVGRGDANFKYRVGDIYARYNAYSSAAKIGKYSSHHWGSFTDRDLTWVKYPDVDEKFYLKAMNDFKEKTTGKTELKNISITLENTVKLVENQSFNSIKNLELNFYYYDHQKEDYVLLKTALVERHFKAGVNEAFEVVIENVPEGLIKDSYFLSGEFIISEIKDYEIPELSTTYRQLMAKIQAKTIPVVFNTPLESKVYFVSTGAKNNASFLEIAKTIFGDQVEVADNNLTKVQQFSNNLGDYTYLRELKDKDKEGKWFVFTNELNRHYLDHQFSTQDKIALSYVTGTELSRQSEEKIQAYNFDFNGGEDEYTLALGNISPNSELNLQLSPLKEWGEVVNVSERNYHEKPGSCGRNCIGGVYEMDCYVNQYVFQFYERPFLFPKNLSGPLDNLFLIVNNDEYSLKTLIQEKKIEASWVDSNLHLVLKNVNAIKELSEAQENLISLKIKTKNLTSSQGLKLEGAEGRDRMACARIVIQGSAVNGNIPLSSESALIDNIRGLASHAGISMIDSRNYQQRFSVKFNSILTNFHN